MYLCTWRRLNILQGVKRRGVLLHEKVGSDRGADDIVMCSESKGTGRQDGELEICIGENRNESKYDGIHDV